MIGAIVRSEDFERVLGHRTRASSAHFAVHFLPDRPSRSRPPAVAGEEPLPRQAGASALLSTDGVDDGGQGVDNLDAGPVPPASSASPASARLWLGTVVPKRHARRSVTRSLLKRQMRQAVRACAAALPAGLWVVRLRAPFDRARFPSAASEALKQAARVELSRLLADAAAPVPARRRR